MRYNNIYFLQTILRGLYGKGDEDSHKYRRGDAPGLNAVIEAVVLSAYNRNWECTALKTDMPAF